MENFRREIFEQLGNLFYALASDQQVPLMASGELKMLLRKDWLTEPGHPSQDKVSEAAHLIGLTIDTLQTQRARAEDTYNSFAAFFVKHREQFSYALKRKILETAESIVKIFARPGQKDIHIQELKNLLELSAQHVK